MAWTLFRAIFAPSNVKPPNFWIHFFGTLDFTVDLLIVEERPYKYLKKEVKLLVVGFIESGTNLPHVILTHLSMTIRGLEILLFLSLKF